MKNTEERKLRVYEAPTVTVVECRVECGVVGSMEMLGSSAGNLESLGSGSAYGNGVFDGDFASEGSGFSNSGLEGLSSGQDYSNLF